MTTRRAFLDGSPEPRSVGVELVKATTRVTGVRRREQEPPEAAERRWVDQQRRPAPAAPCPDRLEPVPIGEQRGLPRELLTLPRLEPEREQRVVLGDRREGDQAALLGVPGDRREVHAGGDVARAGVGQDVLDHAMVAVAVDVAPRGADRAVVDQQRVPARERSRETIDEREGSDGNQRLAVRRPGLSVPRRLDLDEPFAVEPDADLAIASQPAEREVVQQLVGDDDVRCACRARPRCGRSSIVASAERAPGLTSIAS